MATITNNGFTQIQLWIKSQPQIRAELKAWSLSKTTLLGAIQAVENYMVSGFSSRPATSLRSAIEAVTGNTTVTRAQYILVIWANWRLYNFLGGL